MLGRDLHKIAPLLLHSFSVHDNENSTIPFLKGKKTFRWILLDSIFPFFQFPALHDVSWKKMITLRKPPVVDSAPDSHDCPKFLHSDGQHHILDIQFCCKLHSKEKRRKDKRSSSCGHGTRSHLILSESAGLRKKVCRLTGKHFDTLWFFFFHNSGAEGSSLISISFSVMFYS